MKIYLFLLIFAISRNALACAEAKSFSCELENKANHCESFVASVEATNEFLRSCSKDSNFSEEFSAGVNCGSVALAAGSVLAESLVPGVTARVLSEAAVKLVSRIALAGNILSAPLTAYTLFDITAEAFAADKMCFEDQQGKRDVLDFLKATSDRVVKAASPFASAGDLRTASFSEEYLADKYVKNLTCQNLRELIYIQRKKQDALLGPLLAHSKISIDPRKELELTNQEKEKLKLLTANMKCLSPAKRAALLCAVGNAILGTSAGAKKMLGEFKTRKPEAPKALEITQPVAHFEGKMGREINIMNEPPPFKLKPGDRAFVLNDEPGLMGSSQATIYRVVSPNGEGFIYKNYRSSFKASEDARRIEAIAKLSRTPGYEGLRVVSIEGQEGALLILQDKFVGETVQNLMLSDKISKELKLKIYQKYQVQYEKTVEALRQKYPEFSEGQMGDLQLNPSLRIWPKRDNVLVDPVTLEMVIIDPY